LSVLAVLSGAESYDSIELFGKINQDFLKQFLDLKNGIPSHDTINRLFQSLNPQAFERVFIKWAAGLKDEGAFERVIAIDGKTVRGSKDGFSQTISHSFGSCMERRKRNMSRATEMRRQKQRNHCHPRDA
jgi:hypothetical protein